MAQEREIVRSGIQSYPASGGSVVFDMLFLSRLVAAYRYLVIRKLYLRIKFVTNTGSAGARGPSLYNCVPGIVFKDAYGSRTEMPLQDLSIANELEVAGFRNPSNIAASQTGDTQYIHVDLHPVEVQNEVSHDDFGIVGTDLKDTASIELATINPAALFTNGATVQPTTTFQLVAEVEEGEPGKQYPRTFWKSYAVPGSPITGRTNIKGDLRALVVYAGPGSESAGTAMAEQNWKCPEIRGMEAGLPSSLLNVLYERRGRVRAQDQAGVVSSDDRFVRGQAVALWVPTIAQKGTANPDLDTLGIENDGTVPTTPAARIIVCSIVDRPMEAVATALAPKGGTPPSPDVVKELYTKHAVIAGTNRNASSVGRKARRLPIVLRRG